MSIEWALQWFHKGTRELVFLMFTCFWVDCPSPSGPPNWLQLQQWGDTCKLGQHCGVQECDIRLPNWPNTAGILCLMCICSSEIKHCLCIIESKYILPHTGKCRDSVAILSQGIYKLQYGNLWEACLPVVLEIPTTLVNVYAAR